jgi:hypothetical protein
MPKNFRPSATGQNSLEKHSQASPERFCMRRSTGSAGASKIRHPPDPTSAQHPIPIELFTKSHCRYKKYYRIFCSAFISTNRRNYHFDSSHESRQGVATNKKVARRLAQIALKYSEILATSRVNPIHDSECHSGRFARPRRAKSPLTVSCNSHASDPFRSSACLPPGKITSQGVLHQPCQ